MNYTKDDITAVIIAGGRSTRAEGNNKGLLLLHNKPLIQHILSTIKNQVRDIVINVNSDLDSYQKYGYLVFKDINSQSLGPLSGLSNAAAHIKTEIILTLPCDSPFIPHDLASRMLEELNKQHNSLMVADNGRQQNMFMMLKRNKLNTIEAYLKNGGRSVHGWISQQAFNRVNFLDQPQCFRNINTLEELKTANLETR